MSIRTRALFLTGLVAAVSCSDAGNPLGPDERGPEPGPPSGAIQPLDCTVTLATGMMRCEAPQPDAGQARAAGQLIIGGQNVNVRLASSNFGVNADTIQFDVTVENLIRQPIGTEDGITVDSAGVRVFFSQDPVSNNPSGPASVANEDGTAIFLAPAQPYFQWDEMLAQDEVSDPRTWKLLYNPGSTSVSFRVYVAAQVQFPNGWVEVTPSADTLLPGDTLQLTATTYNRVGRTDGVDQDVTWSRSGAGVTTVDASTGEVVALTGQGSGTDTIFATSNNPTRAVGRAVIVVNTPLVADDVTYPALGNVSLNVPAGFGLEEFVTDSDGDTVWIVPATDVATTQGGLITVDSTGAFHYRPPVGFTGTDTYTYTATDRTDFASATLSFQVATRYWFAQAGQTGTGTMASPGTLKTAEAGSAASETIFVLDAGASTEGVNEGIVLKTGQSLIGQGITGSVTARLPMPTDPADSLTVTLLAGGGEAPKITASQNVPTIVLGGNNHVRGLTIESDSGAAIQGTAFGTLTTDEVTVAAVGPALNLTDGTVAGSFINLSSTESPGRGLSLTQVNGTLAPSGGGISGAAQGAVHVSGGSLVLQFAGPVTQGNAAPLLQVAGSHTGSVHFSGNVTGTAGTRLQFNAADGSYTFAGTTTLSGGDAGVDITNASSGTFTFGTGASITNTNSAAAATAFNVYGSSPTVTYSGNIAKGVGGILVSVGEQPGGSVTFQTGTLQATAGSGISLSNADGTVAFNGTTTLSGGASVAVVGGSSGTISFGTGANITNPASAGILVSASAPAFTYAGSVSSNAARPVQIEGLTGGTVAVSGSVTGSGNGILVQNNNTGSGKTITFSGAVNLNTGANEAVTLANNTGATIGFTSGATDLTTTTGNAFAATGGGTVNLSGGSNDISTSTGTALLLNGVTLGASGMSLATLNVSGAAVAPVVLTNVGVTTGSSITVAGGSIAAGNGTRLAVSGGTVNVNWAGNISQSTHNASLLAVTGGHATGTLAFSGTLAASSGNGLQFNNAGGTYNFTGTTTLNGGDAGVDIFNLSSGTFSFGTGTSISNPTGTAFDVNGGSPSITYAGTITQNNARAVSLASMGGSATFSGNITANGASATGISVTSSSANVTFSGGTKSLTTQGNAAVTLTNNSGSILFSGGGLAITTTSGAGLNANGGGGTLQVTGASNTIVSGTGTALSVQNVSIGSDGLTFRSISANGGANGIVLSSTGSTAGLTVTGNGTPGSGGTIQNTFGSDGAVAGNGIYLANTRAVSLAWMQINDHQNNGIRGNAVVGLTMNRVRITGANGTTEAGPHHESAVFFTELTGSASVTNSYFSGGKSNNFRLTNTSGVLNRLTMSSDTFAVQPGNPADRLLNDALLVQGLSSATVNTTIQSTAFQSAGGDLFQYDLGGSAVGDLILTGNAFSNNHSNIASGGGGVVLSAGGGGNPTFTYNVSNNTFRDAVGTALVVSKTSGTGTATGTIHNNQIGVAGVAHSGSAQGSGIDITQVGGGTHTTTITSNTIRQFTNFAGILTQSGNNSVANGGQGRLRMTIQSNTITELSPTVTSAFIATNGIHIQAGLLSGDNLQVCATIGGAGALANTVNGTGANGGTDIRLRALQSTVIALPGMPGSPAVAADRNNFLMANNELNETASSVTGGSGSYSATCPF